MDQSKRKNNDKVKTSFASNSAPAALPARPPLYQRSIVGAKSRMVQFFKDGDDTFRPVKMAINSQRYRTFDTLLDDLSQKVPLPFGVRNIQTPLGVHHVYSTTQLEDGKSYVCSSKKQIKQIEYSETKQRKGWSYTTGPNVKRQEIGEPVPAWTKKIRAVAVVNTLVRDVRPKVITIYRNGAAAHNKVKILFNPRTMQSYEAIVKDMANSLKINGRQHKLYTVEGKLVSGISDLIHGPPEYILCGEEALVPLATVASVAPPQPSTVRKRKQQRNKRAKKEQVIVMSDSDSSPEVHEQHNPQQRQHQKQRQLEEEKQQQQPQLRQQARPQQHPRKTVDKPPQNVNNTDLVEDEKIEEPPVKKGFVLKNQWEISLVTNGKRASGTNARVYFSVYGDKGSRGPFEIGSSFPSSSTQSNLVSFRDVGKIYKIRIGHYSSKKSDSWLLQNVRLRKRDDSEDLSFIANRWLSCYHEDGNTQREFPVLRPNQKIIPLIKYWLTVYTGEFSGAGTSSEVYVIINGERGDTGKRYLRSLKGKDRKPFQHGKISSFCVEAVSLKTIQNMVVGVENRHDAEDAAWYLQKVILKTGSDRDANQLVFYCREWLDPSDKSERTLLPDSDVTNGSRLSATMDCEMSKLKEGNHVILYSKASRKALRVVNNQGLDGNGDDKDNSNTFEIIKIEDDTVAFKNCVSQTFIAIKKEGILSGNGKGNSDCIFSVRINGDLTASMESKKLADHHVIISNNGKAMDPKLPASSAAARFSIYLKGKFRDGGKVMLASCAANQFLSIDSNGNLLCCPSNEEEAIFNVIKIDKHIRAFQSASNPDYYIRMQGRTVDGKGRGDRPCHFRIRKNCFDGYFVLESVKYNGMCLSVQPDMTTIVPQVDVGDDNVQFRAKVVEFGIKSSSDDEQPQNESSDSKFRNDVEKKHSIGINGNNNEVVQQNGIDEPTLAAIIPQQEPDWTVWVSTMDNAIAGTNAKVTLEVCGHEGQSQPLLLDPSMGFFHPGNTERFEVYVGPVGKIYKIRISHDNSTDVSDWFLNKVKMRHKETKEELVFICKRWLSRSRDDHDITRELPVVRANQSVLPVRTYMVKVYTSDIWGADTDNEILINIFGKLGDTGLRELYYSSNNEEKFHRANMDLFSIDAVQLGQLIKIKIGHNNLNRGEGWHLDKVVIHEKSKPELEYCFPCQRWLDSGQDDGLTIRELILHKGMYSNLAPMVKMRSSSDQLIPVENGKKNYTPEPQSPDSDSKSVLEENQNAEGNEKIAKSPDNKSVDQADAVNSPEQSNPAQGLENDDWQITIATSDKEDAGTDAQVTLVVYGDEGISTDITLDQSGEHFQPGDIHQFQVSLGPIGRIYKVRLSHNNQGKHTSWHVDRLKMRHIATHETLMFKFNRWLSRDKDDGDITRELPALRPNEIPLPVIRYHVYVSTGDVICGGTDTRVYLTIIGQRGDSGRRELFYSHNHANKFEQGQTDVFIIEAVSLNDLTSIKIGHTEHGAGAGWFLDKVLITEGDDKNAKNYEFPCHRWLDEGQDDGKIERELYVQEPSKDAIKEITDQNGARDDLTPDEPIEETPPEPVKEGDWEIKVKTSDMPSAGSYANVYLVAYGLNGKSQVDFDNDQDHFTPNQLSSFKVHLEDIGELYKIRIGHDGVLEEQSWHLEFVQMINLFTQETYNFHFDRWLSRYADDSDTCRELSVQIDDQFKLPNVIYRITVYTDKGLIGKKQVWINLYGQHGDCGHRLLLLSEHEAKFRRNQVDTFTIEATSLGQLDKLQMGIKNSDKEDIKSHFRKVVVTTLTKINDQLEEVTFGYKKSSYTTGPEAYLYPNREWLLSIKTGDFSSSYSNTQVAVIAYGSNSNSGIIPLGHGASSLFHPNKEVKFKIPLGYLEDIYKIRIGQAELSSECSWYLQALTLTNLCTEEEYVIKAESWLSHYQGTGETWIELATAEIQSNLLPVLPYVIELHTNEVPTSFSETRLYVTLYGERGDSGPRVLAKLAEPWTQLKSNYANEFTIHAVDLSQLKMLKLEYGESLNAPAWFIDKVVVKFGDTNNRTVVLKSKINLDPHSSSKKYYPEGDWLIKIRTSEIRNAGTQANIELICYGSECVTDKISLNNFKNNAFSAGKLTQYKNYLGSIGRPYKVRVSHDGQNKNDGWHLDYIKLFNVCTEEEFEFKSNRWISKYEDNGEIIRELPVSHEDDLYTNTTYFIQAHFREGFAIEHLSSCVITVYGDNSDSGERELIRSLSNSPKTIGDNVTEFTIEAVALGLLDKAHLSLTSSNESAEWSWPIEKLVLRDSRNPYEEKTFLYKISTDSSHNSVYEKDFHPDDQWLLNLCALKISNSNCILWLNCYGTDGQSTLAEIGKLQDLQIVNNVAKEIPIKVKDIRNIYKVRLQTSDDIGSLPLQVQALDLLHVSTGRKYQFAVDHLSQYQDLQAEYLYQELPAIDPSNGSHLNVEIYEVTVFLKDQESALESDHRFNIQLFGSNGDLGERIISNPTIDSNSVVQFRLQAVDLGNLTKMFVTHLSSDHNVVLAIDKAVIKFDNKDILFKPSSTTDKDVDYSHDSSMVELRPEGTWNILIKTSDIENAGTTANVYLKCYGTEGCSDLIPLIGVYLPGEDVEFQTNLSFIGQLYKIRISHDGLKEEDSWHLHSIELTNLSTSQLYSFSHEGWLSKYKENADVACELAVVNEDKSSLSVIKYDITLMELDDRFNLNQNWYLIIHGEQGDSGKRIIWNPLYDQIIDNDGRKGLSCFVEAVTLQKVKRVTLSCTKATTDDHEDSQDDNSGLPVPCRYINISWLDDSKKQISLKPKFEETTIIENDEQIQQFYPESDWIIRIYTNDLILDQISNSDVSILLYGDIKTSEPLALGTLNPSTFKAGNEAEFQVITGNLGKVYKMQICCDAIQSHFQWHIHGVSLTNIATNEESRYDMDCWLSNVQHACQVIGELPVGFKESAKNLPAVVDYIITIYISKNANADIIGQMKYITIIGDQGDSGKRPFILCDEEGFVALNIEKSQLINYKNHQIRFHLKAIDVGQLDRINIECDDVEDLQLNIDKICLTISGNNDFIETLRKKKSVDHERQHVQTYLREGIWLIKTELNDLISESQSQQNYSITCYGDHGRSEKIDLDENNLFKESDKESIFRIETGYLGDLFKIRLDGQDNGQLKANYWQLKTFQIQNLATEDEYTANFSQPPLQQMFSETDVVREVTIAVDDKDDYQIKLYDIAIHGTIHQKDTEKSEADQFSLEYLYLNIFGKISDSGERKIMIGNHDNNDKDTDILGEDMFKAASIGEIDKVVLRLMDSTSSDILANWPITKITIKELGNESPIILKIKETEADNPFTREFLCEDSIIIQTSTNSVSGTEAKIKLVIYGNNSKTNEMLLQDGNHSDLFQPSQVATFKLQLPDIGALYKIRLTHDSQNKNDGWLPEKVTIKVQHKEYVFSCNRWLSSVEDDGEIIREFAVDSPNGDPLPAVRYQIKLPIEIDPILDDRLLFNLTGDHGDTGDRILKKRKSDIANDQYEYIIEAISLRSLKVLTVMCDSKIKLPFKSVVVLDDNHKPITFTLQSSSQDQSSSRRGSEGDLNNNNDDKSPQQSISNDDNINNNEEKLNNNQADHDGSKLKESDQNDVINANEDNLKHDRSDSIKDNERNYVSYEFHPKDISDSENDGSDNDSDEIRNQLLGIGKKLCTLEGNRILSQDLKTYFMKVSINADVMQKIETALDLSSDYLELQKFVDVMQKHCEESQIDVKSLDVL
ncbi:Lipoxygenase homology domain-containing protein 1 [Trichoplax sp. H2]|nr:Lipoxygenase homology domain-containing protein 1 [Trichoplax sp. H2]|eukprot:RDD41325.1 Lipoxygenase homology domain-containing protein 1 [Trichoplax sp. H2]